MSLNKKSMMNALAKLDEQFKNPVTLIVGGGGAMVMAHGLEISTHDIDAVPKGMSIPELDEAVKKVAKKLNLSGDWLNPWYGQFAHNLPADYESRLIKFFQGKKLTCLALGREDMLIMKCFAARPKDVPHAKLLLKLGLNESLVENHIESLVAKKIPQAKVALDFFDNLMD